jgi:prephenate dehydrogenase
MGSAAPPFPSIAVVGLGLIGGSIALGVRERWPETRVFGVDTEAVLAHALGGGAIERGFQNVDALPDTALIVLAAPVRQNIELLSQIRTPSIVTDVGGTKRDIVVAARALPPAVTFVGGHPLGGGERGGFAFARPDLFAARPWILTPDGDRDRDVLERLSGFISGLGARPSVLSADEHDRLMAFVSHLPQLTASALMDVVGSGVQGGLSMAGRGLVDTTRLASSPADVWRDICLTNADSIADALDCLIQRLTQLRGDLHRGDAVESVFAAAAKWRAELMKDNH